MPRRKRFNSEHTARSFAKNVDGRVNDLREVLGAKSPWTVTYKSSTKTKAHGQRINTDFCPEEAQGFGYPDEYWR